MRADGARDGNGDHADSEPMGFRTKSVLGFGASWAFVGDGEPLDEGRVVVATTINIQKTRSLRSGSEDMIVTFFSDEVAHSGGAVERGMIV
ncbi:hypothetical protein TIFTF001_053044 [Ficus carica]|uniref:Uncharacterized protein n=1 Tax=Ficus carica TaxID=3494 RepID=A0AA88EL58_FICCA|nr:hypothetical protein TIFTF001_053044 [Ficus carica]